MVTAAPKPETHMRKSVLTLVLVAGFALQASPASAASTLSFAGRYTSAYTQWSTSNNTVATTHGEAASKAGAVRAQATAAGDRAVGGPPSRLAPSRNRRP